jgi:hypothetical protein
MRKRSHGDPTVVKQVRDGRTRHPLYKRWTAMIERCHTVPTHHEWHRYGGRGIQVCQRWRDDFWAFAADVGVPPESGLTIDRIDPDGDYEPSNLRWADALTQRHNRGSDVKVR